MGASLGPLENPIGFTLTQGGSKYTIAFISFLRSAIYF
jgi:hypothetical protein